MKIKEPPIRLAILLALGIFLLLAGAGYFMVKYQASPNPENSGALLQSGATTDSGTTTNSGSETGSGELSASGETSSGETASGETLFDDTPEIKLTPEEQKEVDDTMKEIDKLFDSIE